MVYLRIAAFVWYAFFAGSAFADRPVFRIVELGELPGYTKYYPNDLNDNGVVVGSAEANGTAPTAYIRTEKKGIHKAGLPIKNSRSSIVAINAKGSAVVAYFTPSNPNSQYFILKRDGTEEFFLEGTWAEDRVKYVLQMTNSGYVLGSSYFGGTGSTTSSPWVWSPRTGLTRILDGIPSVFDPSRMNDRGQIVGSYYGDCSQRGFVYDLNTRDLTPLAFGTKPGDSHENCSLDSRAYAINEAGIVVGLGNSPRNPDDYHMFLWSALGGYENIPFDDDPTTYGATPSDISEAGQVVGHFLHDDSPRESYFYWDRETGVVDLQDLLDPSDPLSSQVALEGRGQSIPGNSPFPRFNRRGQLLVMGAYLPQDSRQRANRTFLLEPVKPVAAALR